MDETTRRVLAEVLERESEKTSDGCWLWPTARIRIGERRRRPYAVAREVFEIGESVHVCGDPRCVNPAHLRETKRERVQLTRVVDGRSVHQRNEEMER